MLELAVSASLKVTAEEEIASLFSLFAVSAQHCRGSATSVSREKPGIPLWECLSIEQAFLNINCSLFVHYGLVRTVQMAKSAAAVFP